MKASDPPPWAEAFLRQFLAVRDRDTITGDLLEEYREAVVPSRGVSRARIWYLRQVASLLTYKLRERSSMAFKNQIPSLAWAATGMFALCALIGLLIRNRFEPPSPSILLFSLPIVLLICAATALRPATHLSLLWRVGRVWAVVLAAVVAIRIAVDLVVPFNVEQFFLAQSRDGFSEFNFPRRFLLGVAIALVLLASGFHGTWKTGRIRLGILTAVSTSLIVSLPVAAALIISNGSGASAAILLPALGISSLLGSIGAFFGLGVAGIVHAPGKDELHAS